MGSDKGRTSGINTQTGSVVKMYITHTIYKSLGGTCDKTTFNRVIFQVEGLIDRRTFGRLRGFKCVPNEVKQLIVVGVDLFAEADENKLLKSRSESDGGVLQSESYRDMSDIEKDFKAKIEAYLSYTVVSGKRILSLVP